MNLKKFLISFVGACLVHFVLSADSLSSTAKENKIKKTTSTKETKKNSNVITNLVNKIVMIVYTDDEPIIITQLDIQRKTLDGKVRTADEVLKDHLKYYEATHYYKMSGYEEDTEKHISVIKAEYNLDDTGLGLLFKESGYTLEEGKEELRMVYAIRRLMQELIINRIVVSEKEIRDEYNNNRITVSASYKVRKGLISKKIITENQLKELLKTGKNKEDIVWSMPYWIAENELADHKKYITQMTIDQIELSDDLEDAYEVVQLVKHTPEHVKTFEECYNEILQKLRYPKYDELMKSYEKDLLKKYEVVHY